MFSIGMLSAAPSALRLCTASSNGNCPGPTSDRTTGMKTRPTSTPNDTVLIISLKKVRKITDDEKANNDKECEKKRKGGKTKQKKEGRRNKKDQTCVHNKARIRVSTNSTRKLLETTRTSNKRTNGNGGKKGCCTGKEDRRAHANESNLRQIDSIKVHAAP